MASGFDSSGWQNVLADGDLAAFQKACAQRPSILSLVELQTKRTMLHAAAARGHVNIVSELLAMGMSGDAQDAQGNTPLHLAAADGHTAVVQELVHGPRQKSVRVPNGDGRTPRPILQHFYQHSLCQCCAPASHCPSQQHPVPEQPVSPPRARISCPPRLAESGISTASSSPSQVTRVLQERSENVRPAPASRDIIAIVEAKDFSAKDANALALQNLELAEKMDIQSQIMVQMQERLEALGAMRNEQVAMQQQHVMQSHRLSELKVQDDRRYSRHENRLRHAENNLQDLQTAIDMVSHRLMNATVSNNDAQNSAQLEEVQGLLTDLRARTAGLEQRLRTFPTSHAAFAKLDAGPKAALTASDQVVRLSDGRLVLPTKFQLEGALARTGHNRGSTGINHGHVAGEEAQMLVEEQRFLLKQVEARVEVIMATLEDKVVGLAQEQKSSGDDLIELSNRTFEEMIAIRGAVEQRFQRVEADINRLVEQEWRISAAAEACLSLEKQQQKRKDEQTKEIRDQRDKLLQLQQMVKEEGSERKGIEDLLSVLNSSLNAMNHRVAWLETAVVQNQPRTAADDTLQAASQALQEMEERQRAPNAAQSGSEMSRAAEALVGIRSTNSSSHSSRQHHHSGVRTRSSSSIRLAPSLNSEYREALQGHQQLGGRHGKDHQLHSVPVSGQASARVPSPRWEYQDEVQQNGRFRPEGRPPLAPTPRQQQQQHSEHAAVSRSSSRRQALAQAIRQPSSRSPDQPPMHAHGYNEEMALSAGLDMTQEEYYVPRFDRNEHQNKGKVFKNCRACVIS
ncbi:hypothetical protein WJX84_011616 [Apatococcus fuscideae]|uniref:Uncharacterized protein n=1 Tax=Apatococcus fuscideae TaxID=2026836 RepID=A0AAW1T6B1_9CHLO